MLTKLVIRNFKKFDEIESELGDLSLIVGPNDYGKTSILQALTLWKAGVRHWNDPRRKEPEDIETQSVLAINRLQLTAIPVPDAGLLWRNLRVFGYGAAAECPQTSIRIEIIVEGRTDNKTWTCGFEFDYANEESLYCQPLRLSEGKNPKRLRVPREASDVRIVFLPPMSGLAAREIRLDEGAINVRLGEGRTAEVLRNLCYKVSENDEQWEEIVDLIKGLFGVKLDKPEYIRERGEITMTYTQRGVRFDLSSSGRGLQQVLLVITYMYANPGAVVLLDAPDTHLDALRQKQVYELLATIARKNKNQVIATSHSELLAGFPGLKVRLPC